MNFEELARSSLRERADFVAVTATNLGISELVVEKDFWVVWMLARLFSLSERIGPFTFKGGTSLSKGFGLINRFSEDIDISISRSALGFPDDTYFSEAVSRGALQRRIQGIRDSVHAYVTDTVLPELRQLIHSHLGNTGWSLDVAEPGGLRFRYPTRQVGQIGYVRPDVAIEFGHADPWPSLDVTIRPYIADVVASVTGSARVTVLDPRRTFWEKATALHEVAHRPRDVRVPDRFSRHYYDVAAIATTEIGSRAIADTDLLEKVARFKNTFFYSSRARYDLAKPGTIRLMFPEYRYSAIERDYEQMQPMLFGDVPSFSTICERLATLEATINTAR